MKRFKITLYQELYTDYIVTAENEDEARELVLQGEAEEFKDDVDCKEHDILMCEEEK